ncbi:MAG: hypothetical protein COA78_16380 [Blastopirellula sp.]|nr:MAG: hypothetical protein COA78_16380 [Blastopirellula sp.]
MGQSQSDTKKSSNGNSLDALALDCLSGSKPGSSSINQLSTSQSQEQKGEQHEGLGALVEPPKIPPTLEQSVEQSCSICQTSIQPTDHVTSCGECDLPFHVECWEENLGCSAYGCSNVNTLRTGPDIQISSPPPLSSNMFTNEVVPLPEDGIPWEYVLLAGSALGMILGLLCFGIMSVVSLVATISYFVMSGKDKPSPILVSCIIMSLIGFCFGLTCSIFFRL